jgi:hypothetical protein
MLFASAVQAGTVQYPPKVGVSGVSFEYRAIISGASRLGKFTATGTAINGQAADGSVLTGIMGGTFSLIAYFDLNTGAIVGNAPGTSLNVTSAAGTVLFKSQQILTSKTTFTTYSTTPINTYKLSLDMNWEKKPGDSGSLPPTSVLPFIGTSINSVNVLQPGVPGFTVLGGLAYASGLPGVTNNTVLFSSAGGTGNIFMAPMPTAAAGGVVAFGIRGLRRRRGLQASQGALTS